MQHRYGWLICLLCALFLACTSKPKISQPDIPPLFTLIPPEKSGMDFTNQVEDGEAFNILTYRNFYNGGGVAIGDINQDGLEDVYFTANMGSNRLFLNKGNWQFEDITEQAGVSGSRAWSTGVSMVDVNADGLLDIYVCNSGDVAGDNKQNELFINQGDLRFSEEAAGWGLDNTGFSTHASFFDYDGDGDLDCYLLNNSFRSPDKIELYQTSREEVHPEGGDKLYRNDGNHFTDVSEAAGIYSSDLGFGLGVSVSDVNGDMWPDIYVSNDFWERDYLYLNQQNGTFSEELTARTNLCSMSSMGADISDLNNDGAPEIMTTDMLPGDNARLKTMTQFTPFFLRNIQNQASYHYQFLQNSLHLNDGAANFQEIAHLTGVAATDWSWGALIFDMDLDGWKDIFISNGILKDLTDLDFVEYITDNEAVRKTVESNRRADFRDFLPHMPSTPLSNYALVNQAKAEFKNEAAELGLDKPSFSNGAAYADLDNDGDLDLIVNNLNMPAFLYRNESTDRTSHGFLKVELNGPSNNPFGVGTQVSIYADGQQQSLQYYPSRGFESSVGQALIFGLGTNPHIDSLLVVWPDRKRQLLTKIAGNQTLSLSYEAADGHYQTFLPSPKLTPFENITQEIWTYPPIHVENTFNDFDQERLLPRMLSTEGPKILTADVNGDQLEDFLLLGAAEVPNQLYLQQVDGSFRPSRQQNFEEHRLNESTCGAFFDADGDGDQDLFIGHGGNEYYKGTENFIVYMYENDGQGNFWESPSKAPPIGGNLSCVVPADYDQDGDIDLFLGGRAVPGNYGLIPASFLLANTGDGSWENRTVQSIGQLGMVTDAIWNDIDGDNDLDLIVVGEWMGVTIFENENGKIDKKNTIKGTEGWWNAIEAADLDKDGRDEFILGNWGLNSKFQASSDKPLDLYVKDFDNNGKSEFILNWYPPLEEEATIFFTKMDLAAQLPSMKKVALTYSEYATQTYESLFTRKQREGALHYTASNLQSAILWLTDNGAELEALPWQAQVSPIYGIIAEDLDNDGHTDLLLGGNLYGLKPEIGRMDASDGIFLKGKGTRQFQYLSPQQSGIRLEGEIRDLTMIQNPNQKKTILVGRNHAEIMLFREQ
ncbi:MAG: VCBS repeat-containing protein [Bacteroidota bacterium]